MSRKPDSVAVRNAADPDQVKHASRKDRDRRERELADLRAVLAQAAGRRVLWRLLEHCSVFGSIWHPSALIHANAGRQDVGHYLMAEITEANEDAIFTMMQEARAAKRADAIENAAVRTPQGTPRTGDDDEQAAA
jgi:hypothetical protein